MKPSSSERVFLYFFLLSAFLPYIKTSPLSSDLQPHFIAFLLLLLGVALLASRRVPVSGRFLIAATFYTLLALSLSASIETTLAVTLLFLCLGYIDSYPKKNTSQLIRDIGRAAAIASTTYFVFAIVDIFIGKHPLEIIVGNLRYSSNRGVNSLASEPSYLGLVSICLICILEFTRVKRFRLFQALGLATLLSSGSFYAIGPAIALGLIFFAKEFSTKNMFLAILAALIALPLSQLSPERLSSIMENIANIDFYLNDPSTANRLARTFIPIYSSLADFLIPHTLENIRFRGMTELDRYFNVEFTVEDISNISSIFLYGFGFTCLPLIYAYSRTMARSSMPIYYYFLVFFLLTANISAATPYVYLALAIPYLFYHRSAHKSKRGRRKLT